MLSTRLALLTSNSNGIGLLGAIAVHASPPSRRTLVWTCLITAKFHWTCNLLIWHMLPPRARGVCYLRNRYLCITTVIDERILCTGGTIPKYWRKTCPVSASAPRHPQGLAWELFWASVMGGQLLTAWVMEESYILFSNGCCKMTSMGNKYSSWELLFVLEFLFPFFVSKFVTEKERYFFLITLNSIPKFWYNTWRPSKPSLSTVLGTHFCFL